MAIGASSEIDSDPNATLSATGSGEQIESYSYDDDIVRKFATATLLWAVVGTVAGLIVALLLGCAGTKEQRKEKVDDKAWFEEDLPGAEDLVARALAMESEKAVRKQYCWSSVSFAGTICRIVSPGGITPPIV